MFPNYHPPTPSDFEVRIFVMPSDTQDPNRMNSRPSLESCEKIRNPKSEIVICGFSAGGRADLEPRIWEGGREFKNQKSKLTPGTGFIAPKIAYFRRPWRKTKRRPGPV
jgi:hypothetical protein